MALELFAAAARGETVDRNALTAELDRAVDDLLSERRRNPDTQNLASLRNIAFGLPIFVQHGADITSAAQRLVAESGDAETKEIVFTLPLRDLA